MVFRVYVEKKPGLDGAAHSTAAQLRQLPQVSHLQGLRLLNRYDVEGVDRELFARCVDAVFSEPQTDRVFYELPAAGRVLAVEALPGQFDQRADSAAQCIQLVSGGERPLVRNARIYLLAGDLDDAEFEAVKKYLINPVESREASLAEYDTLAVDYPAPPDVPLLTGFAAASDAELAAYVSTYGLAMDLADLRCCRDYFAAEQRDPSLTELRVLDTYWSDHCRHTTFNTTIDSIQLLDPDAARAWERYLATRQELGREKPVNLMDIATGAARYLKHTGVLKDLDESPEINACTVKLQVDVDGEDQPWLLLFKNETHNHPTEIEPFGGAATCLGGAIRDPLSGRAYVYQAMRLTGAADPLTPLSDTIPGKLPQRKLVTQAADGYSSYGNQIGLATGLVDELYHPGYAAKRMEVGAVIGAAPAANVRREEPQPGDHIILLGGKTGRDGCGGATGSSKSHDIHSMESCGAEVQKGNAPEERKLQRLFRDGEVTRLIKRCNDFGAGGVSVACGELADGLHVWLDRVPKKYEGLDGTELAISESQERMAVVVAAKDSDRFCALAAAENLETTVVAEVTAEPRLVMEWRGKVIVDLARSFLDTNGAEKHTEVTVDPPEADAPAIPADFVSGITALAGDLNVCSKRGLSEKFDSTVGAATVLMPFGGKNQRTPAQAMCAKLPVKGGFTETCSLMAWGFDPCASSRSTYRGAYQAVVSSVAKLVASGATLERCWLSFQEYFPKLGRDPKRWGLPAGALLGAFDAQLDLGLGAIGGKDSMSGSFEQLDVPPTLISFAVAAARLPQIVSPEFKAAGDKVILLQPACRENGLPDPDSLKQVLAQVQRLNEEGRLKAAWTPDRYGVAAGVLKMCLGNGLGFRFADDIGLDTLFGLFCGSFILEVAEDVAAGRPLGRITEEPLLSACGQQVELVRLSALYEDKLESVFPCNIKTEAAEVPALSYTAPQRVACRVKHAKPLFLLPAFPGTNCEWDTAAAIERAGGQTRIMVLRNQGPADVAESVQAFAEAAAQAQAIVIPGGFSGGDEPDGSGKFITAFFRNPAITAQVEDLLDKRDGLMCGICNGFQALIKLGLVPFGHIMPMDESCPTLTFNTIGRHQSRLVRTRVSSVKSPWFSRLQVGDIHLLPISHGEGRFICPEPLLQQLIANGQVAAQYVDEAGRPSMDIDVNPNGSVLAIEAITSPDGRVLGKMAHSERVSAGVYRNVPGNIHMPIFAAAVDYFTK
ncbi:MAG: phosphoribosylformylglycinamidine synthase [Firmicutes bacterium]|nr:phosphoribosylformylglycinamidine synthase [Bacillota bacterium]